MKLKQNEPIFTITQLIDTTTIRCMIIHKRIVSLAIDVIKLIATVTVRLLLMNLLHGIFMQNYA